MVSNLDLISIVGTIAVFALLAYAVFWALSIRRALAVGLYRNQALGVALVAAASFFVAISYLLPPQYSASSSLISFIGFLAFYSTFLIFFYWVDTSLRAARRSHPLLRDTLHWRELRKILWPLDIIVIAILSADMLFLNVSTPLFLVPLLIDIISGAIFLPVAAVRSKDPTLRSHLRWFGLFFLGFFVIFLSAFSYDLVSILATIIGLLVMAYALYRSAKSLVPLNRIRMEADSK